jgi:hypothetical protein
VQLKPVIDGFMYAIGSEMLSGGNDIGCNLLNENVLVSFLGGNGGILEVEKTVRAQPQVEKLHSIFRNQGKPSRYRQCR